jgi:acetoin utilization protein AcuB
MKKELVFRWMSHDPITVTPDTGLLDADKIMHKYDIRRLPVVNDDGELIGIVTWGDIREASPSDATSLSIWELKYLLAKVKVKEIMTRAPITVNATDTINTAASLMLENKVGGLPVIDSASGTLRGIITESDIFRLIVRTWMEPGIEETDLVSPAKLRS